MTITKKYCFILLMIFMSFIGHATNELEVIVYETSAEGNKMQRLSVFPKGEKEVKIKLLPKKKFQTITGFGGSFTEASAHLLNQISKANRTKILNAYFGEEGANYSLTRTHMNSCDFSLGHYSYAPVEGDKELNHFSIEEDQEDLIPMIKEAMAISKEGFKIIASPWTAPPWMKTNKDWRGGKLMQKYYKTWALFFSKYIEAYQKEGIKIWGITVENEPLGNDNNWESMHFSAEEMTGFVTHYLGPQLRADHKDVKILGYDQNRGDELVHWMKVMYKDKSSAQYFDGTAVHWYASTFEWFPKSLQFAHKSAPNKYLIQTEACVDSEVPKWKDDQWYWTKEATDWGWDWAPAEDKYLHPKYVPVYRYARDIIGCLNNWVDGWIDWNMVLNKQGGPNWFKNWCVAPVLVDEKNDEVYFTPIYYVLAHFSKYIRPGAVRIGFKSSDDSLMVTAAQNPDGTIALIIFNPSTQANNISVALGRKDVSIAIAAQALQTVIIPEQN